MEPRLINRWGAALLVAVMLANGILAYGAVAQREAKTDIELRVAALEMEVQTLRKRNAAIVPFMEAAMRAIDPKGYETYRKSLEK